MRIMGWAGHMARAEGQEIVYWILLGIYDVKRTFDVLRVNVDGRIILTWIFKKWGGQA
jgi:hypothetical protein